MSDLPLINTPSLTAPTGEWAQRYREENFTEPEQGGFRKVSLISAWKLLEEEVPDDPWFGEPFPGTVPQNWTQLRWRQVLRATKGAISAGGRYKLPSRSHMIQWIGNRPIPKQYRHYPRKLVRDFLPWLKENAEENAPGQ